MNCLVIGGLGFIGSHVCDALALLGHQVEIFDLPNKPSPKEYHFAGLAHLIEQTDNIYNFAGVLGTSSSFKYIPNTIETNVNFAVDVMDLCVKHKKVLVNIGVPDAMWLSPYAISKKCMRNFAQMYYHVVGLKGVTFVPYNVYGEGQLYTITEKLVPSVIHHIYTKQPIPVYGKGQQVIDLIYAKDIAKYIAEYNSFDGSEVHLGSGIPIRVIDVVRKIGDIIWELNYEINYLPTRMGESEKVNVVSPNVIPTIDIDEGLQKTVDWYLENQFSYIRAD